MKSKLSITDDFLDHKTISNLCKTLNYQFHQMIIASDLYFPPKVQTPQSKEYMEMMQKAKDIIAEREYYEMTKSFHQESHTETLEWNVIKRHLLAIINVFFSVIACFVAVFYLGELGHIDIGIRILLSMMGAIVVVVAEGWFFTKDLLNSEY